MDQKFAMKTAVSNNTDRSNVKIVEQYNKIISDYGYEEEKQRWKMLLS